MSESGGAPPLQPPQPPPPVSDQEIAAALHNILVETNPNLFNLNVVVQCLELRLGLNLSHKLDFIRFQINYFFSQLQARVQAQARAHIRPPPPPLQQRFRQQEVVRNVVKDEFALERNLNYHFPQNFSFQAPEAQHVETLKACAQPGKKRRGGPGGLNKPCGVSPELQTIVGQPTMPRTQIVKQLWAYIKKNNLQDPSNKRKINCNDELRLLFETDCTDMFIMNKLLSKHILPLNSDQPSKKTKVEVESGSESVDSVPIVIISEVLANFFGTEEREMSQAEVLRQMWEYVKVNNLEDPANSMAIHCDEKLKELFGCESISALGIPEMLSRRHLTNKS